MTGSNGDARSLHVTKHPDHEVFSAPTSDGGFAWWCATCRESWPDNAEEEEETTP